MSVFAVRADRIDRLWDAARAVVKHPDRAQFALVCGLDRGHQERRYVPFGVLYRGPDRPGLIDDWDDDGARAWARELAVEVWWCQSFDEGWVTVTRVDPDGRLDVVEVDEDLGRGPSDDSYEHAADPYFGLSSGDGRGADEDDSNDDEAIVRMTRSLVRWERSCPKLDDVEVPFAGDGRPRIAAAHAVFRAVAAAMRATAPASGDVALQAIDRAVAAGDVDEAVGGILRAAVAART